ncbi:hypothetical protein G6M78_15415 [Agrobacterium tumefaciens]|uniref:hypothetical protein n=1 Tax=Agrobacterium tumefaciens TaxID=358 RepID=UPI00157466AE|nr:hypothetical protein [Agrobacterium tumefaciens]MCZ7497248.1 hypothetical protein [Rhizobium rhizogenes]NTE56465.1 hypothetical protein [Agrobacterium tumefaciens]NTE74433.1 hypothetical protein [Agrobacterium tumefaciens]
MTICAVVILKDALVGIADGRLTSGSQKSFDSTEKIIAFQPAYKYPIISMSRFDRFSHRFGNQWYLMYAGTYALCTEIINLFKRRISGLYLKRDYGQAGLPVFSYEFDTSRNYMDDYNFDPAELKNFDRMDIITEFKDCLQEKADEWLSNSKPIDCQFILFGVRENTDAHQPQDTYLAYKVTAEQDRSFPSRARIDVQMASPYMPVAIGDPLAVTAIVSDNELQTRIAASIPQVDANDSECDQWFTLEDASRTQEVSSRLIDVISGLNIVSVGGHLLVAEGRHGATPQLSSV